MLKCGVCLAEHLPGLDRKNDELVGILSRPLAVAPRLPVVRVSLSLWAADHENFVEREQRVGKQGFCLQGEERRRFLVRDALQPSQILLTFGIVANRIPINLTGLSTMANPWNRGLNAGGR